MMWNEIKDNLKRIRSLKDSGRKVIKNSEVVALGFVDEDDYEALLVDGLVLRGVRFTKAQNVFFPEA